MNPDDTIPDTLPSPPLEGFDAPKPSTGPKTKPSSPYAIRVEDILKEARRQAGLPEVGWEDGESYETLPRRPQDAEQARAGAEPPRASPSRPKAGELALSTVTPLRTPMRPDPRREPDEETAGGETLPRRP